jgi:hypothetical protein
LLLLCSCFLNNGNEGIERIGWHVGQGCVWCGELTVLYVTSISACSGGPSVRAWVSAICASFWI